jgi:magnesium transporter
VITILSWSADEGLKNAWKPSDIPALLERAGLVVWVDFSAPTKEETALLTSVFRFHPLAVEDCESRRQHPKIEDFADYVFLLTHGVDPESKAREFRTRRLAMFIGRNYLVTYHRERSRSCEHTMETIRRNPRVIAEGSDSVMHQILDFQVDQYLAVLESFEKQLNEVEDRIFSGSSRDVLTDVLAFKRSLMRLRRIAGHQRDVLIRLVRREFPMIDERSVYNLRDVQDHLVRIADLADNYRDLIGSALEAHLALVSQRTNEIMRVLTVVSTLFIPLTFVVGVYGMNFDHMPELRWRYGYAAVWVVMIAIAVGMYVYFKRRGIFGRPRG